MELESLTRWGEVPPPGDDALAEALLDDTAAVPFPVNEELNFKLALWQGDLTKLKVDAIVNCSNEDLNERSGVSGQLFAAAGPQLEEACSKLGGCAPGDVKATRGFKLPAKHVLHAVPPRWRARPRTRRSPRSPACPRGPAAAPRSTPSAARTTPRACAA